jgi:hypothetical protein
MRSVACPEYFWAPSFSACLASAARLPVPSTAGENSTPASFSGSAGWKLASAGGVSRSLLPSGFRSLSAMG